MRRPTRLVPAAILIGGALAACAKDRPTEATRPPPSPAASPSASAASRRDAHRLATIEAGMGEDQVTALLGKPDEIRTQEARRPWITGASVAWAYGVKAPGSFAFGGLVLFDADHKVLMTRSPIESVTVRARKLRWSDTAMVNDRGLSCHLEILGADPGGIDARVTLKNDGAATFERRHGHTGIRFDLVVELFDEGRHILARHDTMSLFSPFAPDDTERMTIPAGGSIAERVRLGATWSELGPLPPGAYVVRVAFPFEVGRFSVSEPVAFRIDG
ncbi:MAG: hypothetical protein QM820_27375 [Minicystis sp.]